MNEDHVVDPWRRGSPFPGAYPKRTRDMTRAQLAEILRRRGWRLVLGGWIDIGGGCSIGVIMTRKRGGWKIDRRASLAKAIREAAKLPAAGA